MKAVKFGDKTYFEFDVLLLPSDTPSCIFMNSVGELCHVKEELAYGIIHHNWQSQELYVISSAPITKGWVIDDENNDIYYAEQVKHQECIITSKSQVFGNFKQVVASTDQSLDLPNIPFAYIEYFMLKSNLGKRADKVLVEAYDCQGTGMPDTSCEGISNCESCTGVVVKVYDKYINTYIPDVAKPSITINTFIDLLRNATPDEILEIRKQLDTIQRNQVPLHAKIKCGNTIIYLMHSAKRSLNIGMSKDASAKFEVYNLKPNEIYYETIYGWGVRVDKDTLTVVSDEIQMYRGLKLEMSTLEMYEQGTDLIS